MFMSHLKMPDDVCYYMVNDEGADPYNTRCVCIAAVLLYDGGAHMFTFRSMHAWVLTVALLWRKKINVFFLSFVICFTHYTLIILCNHMWIPSPLQHLFVFCSVSQPVGHMEDIWKIRWHPIKEPPLSLYRPTVGPTPHILYLLQNYSEARLRWLTCWLITFPTTQACHCQPVVLLWAPSMDW